MNFATAVAQANGKWHNILTQMGVESRYLVNRHGPCPMCGGNDRFRFDNKSGRGDWICSNCGAGDGFSLVSRIKKISLLETRNLIEPLIKTASTRTVTPSVTVDGRGAAERLWRSTRKVQKGSPVWTYITERLNGFYPSSAIREGFTTHPKDKNHHYIMAAKISDTEGRGVSVHKTFITTYGQSVPFEPRKMLTAGSIPPGSAVRLTEPARHMGIAEGIETAMSAHVLFGVPTWSGINATMLKSFQPPKICDFLTIFADNDLNFTGHSAAYDLARRLKMTNQNLKIEVQVPSRIGDWNDVLKGQRDEFRFED